MAGRTSAASAGRVTYCARDDGSGRLVSIQVVIPLFERFTALDGIGSLLTAVFFWFRPEDVLLMYGVNALSGFFLGTAAVLQWAIYTDTADYGEWKFGRRATGLIMAASLFMLKLGLMLGGSLVGWVLGAYGFEANAAQSAETLDGIRLTMSLLPALFGLIAGGLMLLYPLRDTALLDIERDLAARRTDSPA